MEEVGNSFKGFSPRSSQVKTLVDGKLGGQGETGWGYRGVRGGNVEAKVARKAFPFGQMTSLFQAQGCSIGGSTRGEGCV